MTTTSPSHQQSRTDAVKAAGTRIAGQARERPIAAAAIVGGAAAIGAGAFYGSRALARRSANRSADGKPMNAVMETAITACELGDAVAARKAVTGGA